MAGPTTEVLNEDIKEVKTDIHDIRVDVGVVKSGLHHATEDIKEIRGDLAVVKADLHNVATGLAEFKGEVRVFMGLAKWAGALLITTILTSGAAGIWWASGLNGDMRSLEKRLDKFESRFDRFESQLTKLVDQSRPALPTPKAEGPASTAIK